MLFGNSMLSGILVLSGISVLFGNSMDPYGDTVCGFHTVTVFTGTYRNAETN